MINRIRSILITVILNRSYLNVIIIQPQNRQQLMIMSFLLHFVLHCIYLSKDCIFIFLFLIPVSLNSTPTELNIFLQLLQMSKALCLIVEIQSIR